MPLSLELDVGPLLPSSMHNQKPAGLQHVVRGSAEVAGASPRPGVRTSGSHGGNERRSTDSHVEKTSVLEREVLPWETSKQARTCEGRQKDVEKVVCA